MGNQKSVKPKEAERRAKIQAAREAQQKAERRKRTITITAVVVVVLIIVAVIAAVVINGQAAKKKAEAPAAIPTQFAAGEPIIVSDKGVGTKDPNLDDLTIYYSYSCHACAYLDAKGGPAITDAAKAGAYNLLLIPVANVDYPWRGPATNAALWVAAEDPDHFVAFHLALSEFFDEKFNTEKDDTIMADLDKSMAQVKQIAKDTGVKEDVIAKFGDDADTYTNITSEQWRSDKLDRGGKDVVTPEVFYDNKRLDWTTADTGEAILDQFLTQMKDLGYKDPR